MTMTCLESNKSEQCWQHHEMAFFFMDNSIWRIHSLYRLVEQDTEIYTMASSVACALLALSASRVEILKVEFTETRSSDYELVQMVGC